MSNPFTISWNLLKQVNQGGTPSTNALAAGNPPPEDREDPDGQLAQALAAARNKPRVPLPGSLEAQQMRGESMDGAN